ncbi:MAG: hypothetical protein Aurels2KO_31000 [Aureliella sp.]
MNGLRKVLRFGLITCASAWLLTLGIFVDDDISNEFLASSSSPELRGSVFRIRVTADERTVAGVPYIFSYQRTVSRFGLIMLVQCESAEIRELVVKELVIESEARTQSVPIHLRKSRGGIRYETVFSGTLADPSLELNQSACSVIVTCTAIMRNGDEREVKVEQRVPIHRQRQWIIGWLMLLSWFVDGAG